MKPITGQYECAHRSGVGLDYFTSRIDRLIIQANGRFMLAIQDQSRIAHAAQTFISNQQVTAAAPEKRREGNYTQQNDELLLHFDDGGFEPGKIAQNGEGIQLGPNFFNKVSDSTLLPPTHRLKQDMDDIAKGLKIASTLGGMAVKAAKTIQGTIQPGQASPQNQPNTSPQAAPPNVNQQNTPSMSQPPQPQPQAQPGYSEAIFCDQCGARCRPGKRFCNNCGAKLQ